MTVKELIELLESIEDKNRIVCIDTGEDWERAENIAEYKSRATFEKLLVIEP